jgi:ATP-dependent Clp protease protease subunit
MQACPYDAIYLNEDLGAVEKCHFCAHRVERGLQGGAKGKRFALPNSRVMIHQPWGGAQGTAMDMEIQVNEIIKLKKVLEGILGGHTGRTPGEISKESERDHFFDAEGAKNFGLIDHVVAAAPTKSDS